MRRNDYITSLMLGAAALLREDGSDSDIEIFLGGTCNNSTWREYIMPRLDIKYFNPVVDDWNTECQAIEREKRQTCDLVLYGVIKDRKKCVK